MPGTTNDEIADGINWAWNNGAADVLSNSWGYTQNGFTWPAITNAINNARTNGRSGKGCIVVFAAGNTGSFVTYPATVSGVLCVSAITKYGTIANYSSRGSRIDITAIGGDQDIRTLDRMGSAGKNSGDDMSDFGGTSAACPQVSGVAALILSLDPNLTEQQVKDLITQNATDIGALGKDNLYGWGRLDAGKSLAKLKSQLNSDYNYFEDFASINRIGENIPVRFLTPPKPDLASGYYICDKYKVQITLNGFSEAPLGWFVDSEGYSSDEPNNATGWVYKSVTSNSITLATYFYYLKYDSRGVSVNEWAPYNPSKRFIILGKPMIAPVISNFTQSPNPICKGTTGYVYVNLSQGNGNLTYNWFSYNAPSGVTVNFSPNSNRCTITYSSADAVALGAEGPTWDFGCTVSNSVGESTMRYTPILSDCNGCPTLSFEQNGMLFDENPLLITSLRNPGKDVIDYYLINTPITPVNNKIKLTVHEPQTEHSWFDQISLIEATANQGENIVVNEQGQVINYSSTIPLRIMLNGQTDITSALGNMDSVTVQLNVGDVITITRFTEGVEADGDVVLGGVEPPPSQKRLSSLRMNLRKQTITEKGEEVTEIIPITEFFLRPNKSIISKRITNLPSGVIELQVNKPLELDYFAFVINLRTVKTKTLTLNSALHSLNGEIKGKLNNVDGNYGELRPTERIDLTFNTTTTTGNKAYILKTVGRYETDSLYLKGINKPMFTESSEEIPTEYKLFDNYPNPFNPTTVISWQSPVGSWQTLKVYDVLGNQVVTLVNEYREAGSYKVEFNASALASGVYIYKLTAGSYISSKKMMVIK
ncbi:MAG: hypothetical protein KatS3mg036_0535 [Ignavibacterium sp.]|nr:MAG: hypothetical protein KatS3mg036_0535 [Ignavibacterium sp.]